MSIYCGKAVVLLSGGLDSATVAAIAIKQGFDLHALTFSYGQKHGIELEFARRISAFLKISNHIEINIKAEIFSGSALSGMSDKAVPKNRNIETNDDIPATYVPARNIIFLSYALAYAESIDADDIFIGVNAVDYSGYPDCRPEFIDAFERMANVGTKKGIEGAKIKIHAPLINMKKHEIIAQGAALGFDYSLTHSCYDPYDDGSSCGECDSCLIRKAGFLKAGINDPTRYRFVK